MSAQPIDYPDPVSDRSLDDQPDTGNYEVIHLGGQAAVVVPLSDFARLRGAEKAGELAREDAEDWAVVAEVLRDEVEGRPRKYVPIAEVRRRLGIPR